MSNVIAPDFRRRRQCATKLFYRSQILKIIFPNPKSGTPRILTVHNFFFDMTIQSNFEERRFALRLALRLPLVVSGRTDDGETWSEPTETENISTSGALFQLNQNVKAGDKLYVRSHRPDGIPVEVVAEVARLAPAIYGSNRVGVSVSESSDGWIRFFVAWVADDAPPEADDEIEGNSSINEFNSIVEAA